MAADRDGMTRWRGAVVGGVVLVLVAAGLWAGAIVLANIGVDISLPGRPAGESKTR